MLVLVLVVLGSIGLVMLVLVDFRFPFPANPLDAARSRSIIGVLVTLCSTHGTSLVPFKTFASWRLCVRSLLLAPWRGILRRLVSSSVPGFPFSFPALSALSALSAMPAFHQHGNFTVNTDP